MNILTITISHNSSAALMVEGEIVAACCEERYRRIKNFSGYPKNAVADCLKLGGIKGSNVDFCCFSTIDNPGISFKSQFKNNFSIDDYWNYYTESYYLKKLRNESVKEYLQWLRDDPKFHDPEECIDFSYLNNDEYLVDSNKDAEFFRKELKKFTENKFGIKGDRIIFEDHHTCHAYYSYFASPFRKDKCLIVTMDAWGDGRNQTSWLAENDILKEISSSSENEIGRVYRLTTLLLGMRPEEHEFKVMGLAAYAKEKYFKDLQSKLQKILKVRNNSIEWNERPKDLFSHLLKLYKKERFDNIAGAVQGFTEKVSSDLIKNLCNNLKVNRVILGGGIAANIKMNKKISEINEVEEFYVPGSNGDESLSIGGCYYINSKNNDKKNIYLRNMYLGSEAKNTESYMLQELENSDEIIILDNEAKTIADFIAKGLVLGLCNGRAEFGVRALGSRSILADPRDRASLDKINKAIKNRDFWMPFALTILEEYEDQILINPKSIQSPMMATALDTKELAHKLVPAAIHPFDKTARPQILKREDNEFYYSIINEFKNITGVPAILNTSFNLHGEPIVNSIDDAIKTFFDSDMDGLILPEQTFIKHANYISIN
tara:strand:- start:515 stop:2323 length:1809 start_codon:yes stop_codon:yes gene_type:complete